MRGAENGEGEGNSLVIRPSREDIFGSAAAGHQEPQADRNARVCSRVAAGGQVPN